MSRSKLDKNASLVDRDLFSGLIRLHVLHHAVEGPVSRLFRCAIHRCSFCARPLIPLSLGKSNRIIALESKEAARVASGLLAGGVA